MKRWQSCALFAIGGGAYVGLEYLWRGRSHGSMFLAGGVCFLLLGKLGQKRAVPRPMRMVLGALIITAVELTAGLLFNRNHQVWDYRGQPGNFLGQICPVFCLLWIPVAAFGEWLYGFSARLLGGAKVKLEG